MMDHAALQFSPRPGEQMIAIPNDIQPGIDHVFFGPGNRRRADISPFANPVNESVDDMSDQTNPRAFLAS